MIQFTKITIESPLPLHGYLLDNPQLSLKLNVDEIVCSETESVNGNISSGKWEIDSILTAHEAAQSLTLTVISKKAGREKQFSMATLDVQQLIALIKSQSTASGEHQFKTKDYLVEFGMTCTIVLSPPTTDTSQQDISNETPQEDGIPGFDFKIALLKELPALDPEATAHDWHVLGCKYYGLYQSINRVSELDKAIFSFQTAVRLTPEHHQQFATHSSYLGEALYEHYIQTGNHDDIEAAISHCQQALDHSRIDDPEKPGFLNSLAICFESRFACKAVTANLDNAISLWRTAIQFDGNPDIPSHRNRLANALQTRFKHNKTLADLEEAITNLNTAVALTADGNMADPSLLNNLGIAHKLRFEHFGLFADMEVAILCLQQAVECTLDTDPEKPSRLTNLGNALEKRYSLLGALVDLDQAIAFKQNAVKLIPDKHPHKLTIVNNLIHDINVRYNAIGDLAGARNTIASLEEAVELVPYDHPDKLPLLNNIAVTLQQLFERVGRLDDLESAISQPSRLSNLGAALKSRFERLGSLSDITDATASLQSAINLSQDSLSKAIYFNNLGNVFLRLFERCGNASDLKRALSHLQKAVDLTPNGHPDRPARLYNLGSTLHESYEKFKDPKDLENAVSSLQSAVEQIQGDSHRAYALSSLGFTLQSRFKLSQKAEDIDQAVSSKRDATRLLPDAHPDRSQWLSNLGNSLQIRFNHFRRSEDLVDAAEAYSQAATLPSASPYGRFQAACMWADVLNKLSRPPIDAFQCALDLLPRIAWFGLPVPDQHALLVYIGHHVLDAVAAAIHAGNHELAVEWAEQGRSIVWQNLLGLRTPLDTLHTKDEQLFKRLRDISQQLRGSQHREVLSTETDAPSVKDTAQRYSKLAMEWDKTVEDVRKMPGFESFLKPKSFSELCPVASEGPVVILNVSQSRCDALMLSSDGPSHLPSKQFSVNHVPLSGFTLGKGKELALDLKRSLVASGIRSGGSRQSERAEAPPGPESQFKKILSELWLDVVKPVIDALKYEVPQGEFPRIWWCPMGPLAFLPIHAAGLYDPEETEENISDYVISSYTPTLTALLDRSQSTGHSGFQILAVAQPHTPHAPPIPKTVDEIERIERLVGQIPIKKLSNDQATLERVLGEMKDSDWIHLACHGRQYIKEPMKSGLLLHDKVLELSEIVNQLPPKADFAFLSACQTAKGDDELAEESAHLAAGMLLAGYRGIIASMWSIQDKDAPEVAETVYRRMLKDGKPNRREAAYGLHEAVQKLKESGSDYSSWVPFIHIGR